MIVSLAACTGPVQTASTPMAPASAGGSAAEPQTRNSLPRGDVVNAPIAAPTGRISTSVRQ